MPHQLLQSLRVPFFWQHHNNPGSPVSWYILRMPNLVKQVGKALDNNLPTVLKQLVRHFFESWALVVFEALGWSGNFDAGYLFQSNYVQSLSWCFLVEVEKRRRCLLVEPFSEVLHSPCFLFSIAQRTLPSLLLNGTPGLLVELISSLTILYRVFMLFFLVAS